MSIESALYLILSLQFHQVGQNILSIVFALLAVVTGALSLVEMFV